MPNVMVIVGAMALLLFPMSLSVSAQSGLTSEEQDLVGDLQAAMDQFAVESSYAFRGTMNLVQTVVLNGTAVSGTLIQVSDTKINGAYERESDDEFRTELESIQTFSQAFSGRPTPILLEQTLEMVVAGDIFVRFSNLSADLVGSYPEGWVNLNEDPNAFPGAELIRPEQYTSLIVQDQIVFPLNDVTIIAIKEATNIPEALATNTARAITVTYDVQSIYRQGILDAVLGTVNLESLSSQFGMNLDDLITAYMNAARMTITYYLGSENNQIIGANMAVDVKLSLENVNFSGTPVDMEVEQTQTMLMQYNDFGARFDIQAPE